MMIVDAPYPQPTSATFAPARSFASAPSRAGIHDWTRFAPYPGRKNRSVPWNRSGSCSCHPIPSPVRNASTAFGTIRVAASIPWKPPIT